MDRQTIELIMQELGNFIGNEVSIAISDLTQYIYYRPGSQINLNIQTGDPIEENSLAAKALQTGQRVSEYKDNSLFGIPYYGVSTPLHGENGLQGAITVIFHRKPIEFPTPFLTVKAANRWLPVPLDHIVFVEAQNRKTIVHSINGAGIHKYNLSELELSLPSDRFVRCHRSFIVNIRYIEEIHPDSHSTFLLAMKGRKRVPVSQNFASDFRKLLNF